MCELLGFSSDKPYSVKKLLKGFYQHAMLNNHPHGWGLLNYERTDMNPLYLRESIPAYESETIEKVLSKKVMSRLLIGHIRFASKGILSIANTHPFVERINGVDWTLAHNGTLYGKLDGIYKGKRTPAGGTDSERILCRLADALESSKKDEYRTIEETLAKITNLGMMNLIFTDGRRMFVYCNRAKSLFESTGYSGCKIIMTAPLGGVSWTPIETKKLFVYENGREIYSGNFMRGIYYAEPLSFSNYRYNIEEVD